MLRRPGHTVLAPGSDPRCRRVGMAYVIKGTFQFAEVSVVARFAPTLGSLFMQLTEEIPECYRHASRCRERTKRAIDPDVRSRSRAAVFQC